MTAAKEQWTFKPALQLMGGRLVGFVATFFVPIVLVRLFDPETFGTYKQLFLIYTTLFALGQMGMAESLFYFLPLDRERGRRSARYLVNATIVLAISGLVALVALWQGSARIAAWLNNPELAPLLPLIGGYLLLMLASAGLEITLLCAHRYLAATASYALSDLLRALFLVAPALIARDLGWLLVGGLAFGVVRVLAQVALLWRRFGAELRPDRVQLAQQFGYSLPFQLAVIVEVAQINLHQFAVAAWFDTATFAIYAVGCLQLPLVDFAASSAGNVLMVGMGNATANGERDEARAIWTGTTRKLALLLVPMVVVLLLVASDLIPFLFTDAYRASVPVFMVWTAAVVLGVVQTDSALRVFAAVRTILVLNVIRLVIIAGLIAIAVRSFGLVGAVAVTVLASLVAKALALARLRRLLEVSWPALLPWKDLARIASAAIAAAVPPALVRPELERGTFATLAILGVLYAVSLVIILLGFRILEDDELPSPIRRWLRGAARQPDAQPSESR